MPFEYVIEAYRAPACLGRRVEVDGQAGIIVEDRGNHIGVNFDTDKPGIVCNCHPTWKVKYLGMGKIRRITKSQQRYKRYLEYGDSFNSFIDFCYWDAEQSW